MANFENAIQENTSVIYLETPNSWTYAIQDLRAIATLAKKKNIITICDNSYCTPIYQRPIEMGIDLSLQSATKYISGHSDTVAGVVSGSKEMIERIFNTEYMAIGSGIQPFNAWLLLRGLRTLPIRLERTTATAKKVIAFLQHHQQVEKVLYPLIESFEQHELATRQMTGAGGMLTFIIKANNIEGVDKFCESLQHILIAVSWGGYESLIIPKAAGFQKDKFSAANPDHRMLRLYVGLEEPEYIIADLQQAFEKMLL